MKKIVFILLLALMPLQTSWGVVSAYVVQQHETCLHSAAEAQEVQKIQKAQKAQEAQAKDGGEDHSNSAAGVHHEDRFCGLHAPSIVDTFAFQDAFLSSSAKLRAYEPRFVPQTVIEKPERPKWPASA